MITSLIIWITPLLYQAQENKRELWGFYGHELVNEMAIYTLPPEMSGFFRYNRDQLIEHSADPDKRRYAVEWEASRHFMDMDHYPDSLLSMMPLSYSRIKEILGEEFLNDNGSLPWNIDQMIYRLTLAFSDGDEARILKLATELGHYLGDANVPLHTVSNYNGQKTGQHGIHALWETRIPEIYAENFELITGGAQYLADPHAEVWKYISRAHAASDSVLIIERQLMDSLGRDRKYSFEQRGNTFIRVESREYVGLYNKKLDGMVERQLRNAILLTGSVWYTCWVNAGMPGLPVEKHKRKWDKIRSVKGIFTREH